MRYWMSAMVVGGMAATAGAEITLIGKTSIAGDALDKSGFTDTIGKDVPQNRLGSFGSGIDYTGKDDLYVCCDDRGPGDGAAPFRTRFQTFRIRIDPASASPVNVEHVKTTMLTDEEGRTLTGLSTALSEKNQRRGARFDPEGIRLGGNGTVWISDEYGPWIDGFSMEGRRTKRVEIPARFMVAHPSGDPTEELPPENTKGRQSNHGFEGLAMSPDRTRVLGVLQAPLIQDGALSAEGKRIGVNVRMLEVTLATGATREFVYVLSRAGRNVNEAVAIDDHRVLVIERDGAAAKARGLFVVDLAGATDVSKIESLPTTGLPEGVVAAKKGAWLDLMDPKFGLCDAGMPEKIEGLTFGPMLADGRRTLIVTTDNDVRAEQPSWFWVFAFEGKDLGMATAGGEAGAMGK